MSYKSVDSIQKALGENVFHYAKDTKKAAGRALGTIVEIITFYLLKTWGFDNSISIEKRLEEYGNSEIKHNVEYSLHPVMNQYFIEVVKDDKSITANRILKTLNEKQTIEKDYQKKNNNLLSKHNVLRNACTIAVKENTHLIATLEENNAGNFVIPIYEQHKKPYAIFECKRVGVEEGMKKGPQTIEKAKQGAYVAKTISSLQKIRTEKGELYGIIYKSDNSFYSKPYLELIQDIISSDDIELLRKFILTVGIVSNHGNWFTAENQNKEIKVLAQAYDWLLFLTDQGLSKFIEDLILNPTNDYLDVKSAFTSSYSATKKKNQFTKIQMNRKADKALQKYFSENLETIENWFNIITPSNNTIQTLKDSLSKLHSKNWKKIL